MSKYHVAPHVAASAKRCEHNLRCIEEGPSCKVGAYRSANALLVYCQGSGSCGYRSGIYVGAQGSHAMCTCPVRTAIHHQYRV